jgi:hypothetical protein
MRKITLSIILIVLGMVTFSCKKGKDIEITSLGKSGEEFYYGEKVPVWAVTAGDKDDISYDWSATGGSFDGYRTQHLFENLWVAPGVPGEYTVTATAKSGGHSSSKSTTLKVTRYFFDDFQSAYTLAGNGWSTSNTSNNLLTDNDPAVSRLELTASATSAPNVRRSLNLAELKIPFSIKTVLGWKTYFRPGSAIVISLYFNQPANPNYPYIREIRWEIWPTADPATTDNYQLRYETFIPATNVSQFSTTGNVTPAPLPLIDPVKGRIPALAIANGGYKNLSFSVDASNVFHAYVDGALWFTSNGIKDWLAYAKSKYAGFEDPVAREYRVTFPAKDGSNPGTLLVMKSVYINNDGTILK